MICGDDAPEGARGFAVFPKAPFKPGFELEAAEAA